MWRCDDTSFSCPTSALESRGARGVRGARGAHHPHTQRTPCCRFPEHAFEEGKAIGAGDHGSLQSQRRLRPWGGARVPEGPMRLESSMCTAFRLIDTSRPIASFRQHQQACLIGAARVCVCVCVRACQHMLHVRVEDAHAHIHSSARTYISYR